MQHFRQGFSPYRSKTLGVSIMQDEIALQTIHRFFQREDACVRMPGGGIFPQDSGKRSLEMLPQW
ncbi:MAG: hypothetical protein APF82_09420 [Sphingomonadales bacterium BRH_c42]|nr:MAG: hypothetical protein APF82_09420 [Sphingomonadales bacterium BRH_c42]